MRLTSKLWSPGDLLFGAMPIALLAGAWLIGEVTIDHLLRP